MFFGPVGVLPSNFHGLCPPFCGRGLFKGCQALYFLLYDVICVRNLLSQRTSAEHGLCQDVLSF